MGKVKPAAEIQNPFSLETTCRSSNPVRNLLEIIESHPSESAVNFGKSILYFIDDDYDKMSDCLELLIENHPDLSLLHHRIAEVFIHQKNYQKAILHLEKVAELDEANFTAKMWLCLSHFKLGNTDQALTYLSDLESYLFVLKKPSKANIRDCLLK